jgi:hypothetical protein
MQPIHVDGACSRMIPAQRACRMRPATRRRIEGGSDVKSDARDDRLQTYTKMRLHGGERNNSRPPPYASISRLRSVKGVRCARLRLPLDPRYGASARRRQKDPADDSRPSHFMKGLDNFLLIEGIPVIHGGEDVKSIMPNVASGSMTLKKSVSNYSRDFQGSLYPQRMLPSGL